MSRRKSGEKPSKRPGRDPSAIRASGRANTRPGPPRFLPTSEISAKLAHLSEAIDALPSDLVGEIATGRPGTRATGVEATDHGLLIGTGRATSADVVAIDAQPDPDNPGAVVIRLDGWKGPLLIKLTRDRAEMLVSRLGSAVEKVRDWYGTST